MKPNLVGVQVLMDFMCGFPDCRPRRSICVRESLIILPQLCWKQSCQGLQLTFDRQGAVFSSKLFRICSCCYSTRKTNLERWLCASRDYSVGDGPRNPKDGHTLNFVQLPGYMPGLLPSSGKASRNDKHLIVGLWRRFTCIRTLERPRLVSEGRRIWFLSEASASMLWRRYILRAI